MTIKDIVFTYWTSAGLGADGFNTWDAPSTSKCFHTSTTKKIVTRDGEELAISGVLRSDLSLAPGTKVLIGSITDITPPGTAFEVMRTDGVNDVGGNIIEYRHFLR